MLTTPVGRVNAQSGGGKGGFQGYCYLCGGWGHRALDCATKSSGKGKGKGGAGKGKSLHSFGEAFESDAHASHDCVT